MTTLSSRGRQKSDRRSQLLAAAEQLIAERGFPAVRIEDIGAAAGVSGPAIYRHFAGKEALLVELLVGISTRLLAGAQSVLAQSPDPAAALDGLIDFHLDFALRRRSDPHPGPRPGEPPGRGPATGSACSAKLRRDLGGCPARTGPPACRRSGSRDGARGLRSAQLHAAQHEADGPIGCAGGLPPSPAVDDDRGVIRPHLTRGADAGNLLGVMRA